MFHIAFAKGGPEAIVESFYSVVASQQQDGGQLNETLSLRAKLDWSLPNVMQSYIMVKEIAKLYFKGSKEHGLKKHSLPIIGDNKRHYKQSKVLDRIGKTNGRILFCNS